MRQATPGNIEFAGSLLNKALQGGRVAGQNAATQNWLIEDARGNRYDAQGRLVQ